MHKKLEKMIIMEAQKVEYNSRKIACPFVDQEMLKRSPKNGNLWQRFYARKKHSKIYPFWTTFSLCMNVEKSNWKHFFLNHWRQKKWPKFWIYGNIKVYLEVIFFRRLCLTWKINKQNIIFTPFLESVKSLIKGEHFWPFFLRFCVQKNAGTDPVIVQIKPLVL